MVTDDMTPPPTYSNWTYFFFAEQDPEYGYAKCVDLTSTEPNPLIWGPREFHRFQWMDIITAAEQVAALLASLGL